MDKQKELLVNMIIKIIAINIMGFGLLMLVFNAPAALLKGIALGMIFTILRVLLMNRTFERAVKKEPSAAINYTRAHYMLRYVLTFVVIFIGVAEPSIHPVAVIWGLLSLKGTAFWEGIMMKPTPKDGSVVFVEWPDDRDKEES